MKRWGHFCHPLHLTTRKSLYLSAKLPTALLTRNDDASDVNEVWKKEWSSLSPRASVCPVCFVERWGTCTQTKACWLSKRKVLMSIIEMREEIDSFTTLTMPWTTRNHKAGPCCHYPCKWGVDRLRSVGWKSPRSHCRPSTRGHSVLRIRIRKLNCEAGGSVGRPWLSPSTGASSLSLSREISGTLLDIFKNHTPCQKTWRHFFQSWTETKTLRNSFATTTHVTTSNLHAIEWGVFFYLAAHGHGLTRETSPLFLGVFSCTKPLGRDGKHVLLYVIAYSSSCFLI